MNRKNIAIILLLISLTFNLAFIGNFIYHKYFVDTPFSNCQIPKRKIEDFRKLRYSMIEQRRNYLKKRREFIILLQQPHFDEKKLQEKLNATIKEEIKMEKKIGENLIKLRSKMNDKEARLFFGRFFKRKNIKRRIRQ